MKIEINTETAPQYVLTALARFLTEHEPNKAPKTAPIEEKQKTETEAAPAVEATKQPAPSIFDKPPEAKPETQESETRFDHKGVAFDAQYCANAKEPFYSSGPTKGQWKKRVGVPQLDYDDWYASRLPTDEDEQADAETDEGAHTPAPVDTAAAFGGATQNAPTQAPTPEDAGQFYAWLAQMQAEGKMTSQDISQGYQRAGVAINDLFPPTPPEKIAASLAAVFNELTAALNG